MTMCGEHTAVKDVGEAVHIVSLPCRSWRCEDCQPDRRRQLIAIAISGDPTLFLTLTRRRDPDITPAEAAAQLSHAWRLIRLRARREAKRDVAKRRLPSGRHPADGWTTDPNAPVQHQVELGDEQLPFLAVFEAHASGWPHLHILARAGWIAQRWLSLQCQDLLDSPVVHVTRLKHPTQAAVYACK